MRRRMLGPPDISVTLTLDTRRFEEGFGALRARDEKAGRVMDEHAMCHAEADGLASGVEESRPGEGVLSYRGGPVGAVMGGCLCFEGTRIPVDMILRWMLNDDDEEILYSYPSLTQLDLEAARWYDDKWNGGTRGG